MKNRDETILKIFAENVRYCRKTQNLSQEDLAYKTGLHRTYIGMIERAEKNITLININKIAQALGVKFENLMYRKRNE